MNDPGGLMYLQLTDLTGALCRIDCATPDILLRQQP